MKEVQRATGLCTCVCVFLKPLVVVDIERGTSGGVVVDLLEIFHFVSKN